MIQANAHKAPSNYEYHAETVSRYAVPTQAQVQKPTPMPHSLARSPYCMRCTGHAGEDAWQTLTR